MVCAAIFSNVLCVCNAPPSLSSGPTGLWKINPATVVDQ